MWLTACPHPGSSRTDGLTELLRAEAAAAVSGTRVYEGDVFPRGTEALPVYRYERWVDTGRGPARATHLTYSAEGVPLVLQQAVYSESAELESFFEVHAQTGLVGRVVVAADGSATFETTVSGRTRTRTEGPGAPLVVGPTLFSVVQKHRTLLETGASVPIRFVVLERLGSVRFVLRRVETGPGADVYELAPAGRLTGWIVPTARLELDGAGRILRYDGLVPPQDPGGRKNLDASVVYTRDRP